MRAPQLPGGYARIGVLGVASTLVLLVVSAGSLREAPRATPVPSAEELAVIASSTAGHSHDAPTATASPSLSPATTPAATKQLREAVTVAAREPLPSVAAVAAREALPLVGAVADGAHSRAYDYGDRTRKRVALTFDCGADVGYAADILDTLAREHAVASFGMTGAWAEQNPALVKRMVAEGDQLINHTWDHASFTGASTGLGAQTRAQRWEQLDRTEAIIQRLTGTSTLPFFRPPYGDMDGSVLADVGARGYTVTAMWAVDSLGWNGLSAPRIVERTLRLTSPGAILIFHVGSQSQDAAALPAIIRGLRDDGYEFVSMATLVS